MDKTKKEYPKDQLARLVREVDEQRRRLDAVLRIANELGCADDCYNKLKSCINGTGACDPHVIEDQNHQERRGCSQWTNRTGQ